jgi:hypothetical protein
VLGGSSWSADRKTKFWLDDSLVFDTSAGQWVAGPRLANPLAEMMFASDGHALYVAGGKDGRAARADAFRVVSRGGAWAIEPLAPLPMPASGGAAAVLDGVFYVAAGQDGGETPIAGFYALETDQPSSGWKTLAPVPPPARAYPALAACGGFLYLFGGVIVETPQVPVRQTFKDVYRYDPRADEWARMPDLPLVGQGWVAEAVDEHHLLVTGRADTVVYRDVLRVDVRDSSAQRLGELVIPSLNAPLVPVSPGRWWLVGGEPDANRSRTPRVSVIRLEGRPPESETAPQP